MSANLVNYIILGLYAANIVVQGYYGNGWQMLYWLGATILTIGIIGGVK